jgi:hypothetical protein
MIKERPGEKDDRDHVISNIDNDRFDIFDRDKFGENYEKVFGEFIPWWMRQKSQKCDKS